MEATRRWRAAPKKSKRECEKRAMEKRERGQNSSKRDTSHLFQIHEAKIYQKERMKIWVI